MRELNLTTARGIEVHRDGSPVDTEETRRRGLLAVGRKLLFIIDDDRRLGRRSRPLSEIEMRAVFEARAARLGL